MMSSRYSIGVLFLHAGCNMRCRFCITSSEVQALTFRQAETALDVLAQRGIGGVVLGGGEPFTWRPGVLRLAGAARARGFEVQIGTNGIALPEGWERHPAVDRYVLPLDGMDATVHNRMRSWRDDHHALILERLETLRQSGKEATVSTVVTAENLLCLPRIADFLGQFAAAGGRLHAWHLYKFIPAGRGGSKHAAALHIGDTAYHAACERVRSACLPFPVFKRKDMRHSATVDFFWLEAGNLVAGSEVWENGVLPASECRGF